MRIWHGCSTLFFTLNHHDIRSPLTLALVTGEHFQQEQFSLDLPDHATEDYLAKLLGANPRLLHQMAAQDPLAATRCFHHTVRSTIQTLFNCGAPGKCFADALPAQVEPGVLAMLLGMWVLWRRSCDSCRLAAGTTQGCM